MTLMSFLILLVVAGICGSIGQAIAGYSAGGCLVSIALGFIGALVGMWMAHALHLPELFVVRIGGESFPVIWSIVGAAVFVAVISLITRRR
jgi:uncharacterized membrane protein YeaQ/YmgE (transglycosylase-associated protein family)